MSLADGLAQTPRTGDRLTEEPSSIPQLSVDVATATFAAFLLLRLGCESPLTQTDPQTLARGSELPWSFVFLAPSVLVGFLGVLGLGLVRFLSAHRASPNWTKSFGGLGLVRLGWLTLTLAFIGYHLLTISWPVLRGELYLEDINGKLSASLSSVTSLGVPVQAFVYLIGLAGVCFHLGQNVSEVWLRPGLRLPHWAERVLPIITHVLSAGLFLLSASQVLYFATGVGLFDHLLPAG